MPSAFSADLIWPATGRTPFAARDPLHPRQTVGTEESAEKSARPGRAAPNAFPHALPGRIDQWPIIVRTIDERINRRMAVAFKQAGRPGPPAAKPPPPGRPLPMSDLEDERTLYHLLRKIHRVDRQERFRRGHIR
jgi:hypothetical protein